MKDRNVNSYNLLYAQQILFNLSGGKTKEFNTTDAERQVFVRLDPKKALRPSIVNPSEKIPEDGEQCLQPFAEPEQKFTDWESCIAWCMGATRAESAFVVDSQGFIIAMRGRIPGHGFECIGAELIYAMDQLERIDPDAGKLLWIDLDFNKRQLVGFVTPPENGEYYIVGLVTPDPSYIASKHLISKLIIESLTNMN